MEKITKLRPRLLALAYHLLGNKAESEDIVQDAFQKYIELSNTTGVQNIEAYLATIVKNKALDRLRQIKRRKYIGVALPEPIFESTYQLDNAIDCGFAMTVVLSKLAPKERGIFLLRECFGFEYKELASQFGLTQANCRKIFQRSKEKLQREAPIQVDRMETNKRLIESFTLAVQTGQIATFQKILKEDIMLYSDGGGKVAAAIKPVIGWQNVGKFMVGISKKSQARKELIEIVPIQWQDQLYFVHYINEQATSFIYFQIQENKVAAIYIQRNPNKLEKVINFVTKGNG